MDEPRWNLREIISRVMAGGALGVLSLTLVSIAVGLTAILLRTPPKGSWTTDVAIWMAIYGLPGSFLLGAIAGINWQCGTAIHSTLIELIVWCLVVILCCFINSPAIEIVRRGRKPLWELVPDIMVEYFGILAIVGVIWLVNGQ